MDYKLITLSNGLRLLIVPMPFLQSATVSVWVKAGSRNESDEKLGLSHFLEHMAFKGGKKYPSAKAVSEAIDELGGEFNASTSKEVIQYYIRIRSKLIEKAFDVLSDIVIYPNLNEKEITKERGVILEEMSLYEDTPVHRIWDIFEQLIFANHPLGRDIIGTKKTVPQLKKGDFVSYKKKYFYADNMLISVAGGISEKEIKCLAGKYFGGIESGTNTNKTREVSPAAGKIKLVDKKVEQAHMILGFPAGPLGSNERYQDAVTDAILGSGMSSRLFSEVREKRGLAYSIRSDIDRFADCGYFAVYAGVDPKNGIETIKVILNELYNLSASGLKVGKKELAKAKEYLKGHLALSLEDTRGVSSFFGYEELMLGKIRTPDEVFEEINKIQAEDIYESARNIFKKEKVRLAITGPYKKAEEFAKILE